MNRQMTHDQTPNASLGRRAQISESPLGPGSKPAFTQILKFSLCRARRDRIPTTKLRQASCRTIRITPAKEQLWLDQKEQSKMQCLKKGNPARDEFPPNLQHVMSSSG
jgi:hypothetical protein